MALKEDIRPITYLKNKTADLLAQVNETRRPVIITQNGEPRGVLQDPASYEKTRTALLMLKLLAQGEEEVRAGRTIPQERVFADVRKRLKARERRGEKA